MTKAPLPNSRPIRILRSIPLALATLTGPTVGFALSPELDQTVARASLTTGWRFQLGEADTELHFSVRGRGRLEAVDNGNAATTESFKGPARHAFHGLALAIVRSADDRAGAIHVLAQAEGLHAGMLV